MAKGYLSIFLNYRAIPHSTTGFAPAELLFNHKIKTKLPQISTKRNSDIDQTVKKNDERAKERMKKHADKRSRARVSNIRVADTVLICQRKQNKWSTKFDPFPFIVVRRKGTMVTASRNGKYISRNVCHFKKIISPYTVVCNLITLKMMTTRTYCLRIMLKLLQEMSHLIHTDILDVIGDQPDSMDRMFMNSEYLTERN